ncbi:hypothetical protein GG344DRAFT_83060 [Lentinula edodes]|nr:hypothetical protein GG344DRAFT_83060 [Lentinula edodes]
MADTGAVLVVTRHEDMRKGAVANVRGMTRRRAEEEEAARVAEVLERQKRAAAARRQAAQDAHNRAIWAQEQESEVAERQKRLAEAATSRSRRDTSTGGTSALPMRPIVEVTRMKNKGKGKASAQPVDDDPDDPDDGDDADNDEEREPCE